MEESELMHLTEVFFSNLNNLHYWFWIFIFFFPSKFIEKTSNTEIILFGHTSFRMIVVKSLCPSTLTAL